MDSKSSDQAAVPGSFAARDMALVALFGCVMLLPGLGQAKLWDRDETRNARCSVEMMERGDWIVPTMNGELRAHKPALTYWTMIASYHVWGVNEFAARFSSALWGVGTLLCVYWQGRLLYGRLAAALAVATLGCAVMFQVASRAATPDAPLIFFVTAALTVFADALFATTSSRDVDSRDVQGLPIRHAITGYALLGLAVLAKGPVGVVLPVAIILGFLAAKNVFADPAGASLWRRAFDARHWFSAAMQMRLGLGLAVVLCVAAPWYLAVGWATAGKFLREFFLDHNVHRAIDSMEGHRGGPWFYPVAITIGFFPGSVFLLPTVLKTWGDMRTSSRDTLATMWALAWIAAFVGAFTLAGTKLPSYVTPCYPAVALLVGATIARWLEASPARWIGVATSSALALVGVGLGVALMIELPRRAPGHLELAFISMPLVVGGLVGLVFAVGGFSRERAQACVAAMLVGGMWFALLLAGWAPGRLNDLRGWETLATPIAQAPQGARVGAIGCLEAGYVFYSQRTIEDVPIDQVAADDRPFERLLVREVDLERMSPEIRGRYTELGRAALFPRTDRHVLLGLREPRTAQRGSESSQR